MQIDLLKDDVFYIFFYRYLQLFDRKYINNKILDKFSMLESIFTILLSSELRFRLSLNFSLFLV